MRTIYLGAESDPAIVLRELFDLAENPRDVNWLAGEHAVEVPDYLADLYLGSDKETEEADADQPVAPVKKTAARKAVKESSNGD